MVFPLALTLSLGSPQFLPSCSLRSPRFQLVDLILLKLITTRVFFFLNSLYPSPRSSNIKIDRLTSLHSGSKYHLRPHRKYHLLPHRLRTGLTCQLAGKSTTTRPQVVITSIILRLMCHLGTFVRFVLTWHRQQKGILLAMAPLPPLLHTQPLLQR